MTRVFMTAEAQDQVADEVLWWYEHRPKNPFLFEDELLAAVDVLSCSPNAGLVFAPRRQARRYLLSGSRYHVYYKYDPIVDDLSIVAVWSSVRRRGPPARLLR